MCKKIRYFLFFKYAFSRIVYANIKFEFLRITELQMCSIIVAKISKIRHFFFFFRFSFSSIHPVLLAISHIREKYRNILNPKWIIKVQNDSRGEREI